MTGATESLFTKATYYKKREGLGTGYGCNHWVSGECYPPLTLWRPSIRNFFLKNGNGMAKNGHYRKKTSRDFLLFARNEPMKGAIGSEVGDTHLKPSGYIHPRCEGVLTH